MALSDIPTEELRNELLRRKSFIVGDVKLYLGFDKNDVVLKSEKNQFTQIEIRFCAYSRREKPVAIYGTKNTHFEWFDDVYG